MSVNSSRHVQKHTKQHKESHLLAPSDRVCRSSRPASPRVCGWLVVVFSMCHRDFTRFPTGTWVSQIRKTVSQNCVKPFALPICCKATCRHPILSRNLACPTQSHKRKRRDPHTCVQRACGKCVCGCMKNLHMTSEKDVEDQSGSHEKKNSPHSECVS